MGSSLRLGLAAGLVCLVGGSGAAFATDGVCRTTAGALRKASDSSACKTGESFLRKSSQVKLSSSARTSDGSNSRGRVGICSNQTNGNMRSASCKDDCRNHEDYWEVCGSRPASSSGYHGDDDDDCGGGGSGGGTQGPPGPVGPMGPQGPAGPAGPQGLKGDAGATGATGLQGPKGDAGAAGLKGDAGAAGLKGDTGATGPQGAQGLKGDAGNTGATGPQGDTGANGATGPQGAQGLKGDTGAGFSFQGRWDSTHVYSANDIVTFTDGSTYLAIPPTNSGVTPGSDTTTWQIFAAAGAQGAQGVMGPQGVQGPKGDKGDVGMAGLDGANGKDGAQGAAGLQGVQGPKGDPGNPGPQGPAGSGGGVVLVKPADTFFDTSWKTVGSLKLNPASGTGYLLFGKGYLEPRGEGPYLTADCQLLATPLTDDKPSGPSIALDSVELKPFYIEPRAFISVPQALVLQGALSVPAGGTWRVEISCMSDGDRAGAVGLSISAIQATLVP